MSRLMDRYEKYKNKVGEILQEIELEPNKYIFAEDMYKQYGRIVIVSSEVNAYILSSTDTLKIEVSLFESMSHLGSTSIKIDVGIGTCRVFHAEYRAEVDIKSPHTTSELRDKLRRELRDATLELYLSIHAGG